LHHDDKLMIDTPEQIALELPIAGIGSRSLAFAIDSLLQLTFIFLLLIALVLILPSLDAFLVSVGAILWVFIIFFFYWGYYTLFEIIWNGQSPGKRIVRIRIIKESGRPITAVEVIGRNLVRAIDMQPFFLYGVGLICMLLNKKNKRLGDFVAGTIAVHDQAIEKASTIWNSSQAATEANPQIAKISPEELVLIETYLNRRTELTPKVRKQTAAQIAFLIQNKLGIERAPGQSDDAFLDGIARQVRSNAGYR
jgi:uncharacterized RDD family membrane protein YckC